MSDYYKDLGVDRDASAEEIKRAYRRQARKLHPDVNPGADAEEQFKVLSRAYDVLSDADKKQAYDMGADPYAASGGGGDGFGQGFNFSDVMDAFFGAGGSTARGPRSRRQHGQDALVRLDIELSAAVFGSDEEVTLDTAIACTTCDGAGAQPGTGTSTCSVCQGRGEVQSVQRSFLGQVMTSRPCSACQGFGTTIPHPCFECSGQGRVRTRRTLKLRVPAGVDTGTRIQLRGEGEVGLGAGPAGDLYVEVNVTPHETYVRRGDDLHVTLELPMTAAALGTQLGLSTFDGTKDLDVAPGAQPGDTQTMRALGVTHLRSSGRGDLIVHLDVKTPTKVTPEQEALLRELATMRGEERPEGRLASLEERGGILGKLRDAFKAH
ncbi:MAG: molecular chaperone DnaJ [Actinomycetota bacterium]|nr:molecular chaperone DnaJ [Actinomycetota bacterium]